MLSRNARWTRILTKNSSERICTSCITQLIRPRHASTSSPSTILNGGSASARDLFRQQYFLANDLWTDRKSRYATTRTTLHSAVASSPSHAASQSPSPNTIDSHTNTSVPEQSQEDVLPHRRKRRRKEEQQNNDAAQEPSIPLDASSQLSNLSSQLPQNSLKQRFFTYLSLSKPRLTFLIVLTTTSAYTLFPVAVSPMSSSLALSPLTLLNLTTGTALSSACANALNMLFEPQHDAKMSRTKSRPLVRGLLTPRAALGFAAATGIAGVGLLHFGVHPAVAFLSALNIFVYAGMYTPMKRISVANTWVGAIVGGIPPLMGWTAAAAQSNALGQNATWQELLLDPNVAMGGWLLAALLFAWQFPHFNALSYTIRHEYAAAGYKMLASINPRKNGLIALRYSLLMFPICAGLSWAGVTNWAFFPVATVVNGWMTKEAWRFYRYEGAKGSARGLFWASVWHLPIILVLAMAMKKGLWDRVIYGGLDEEEWEEFTAPRSKADTKEEALAQLAV